MLLRSVLNDEKVKTKTQERKFMVLYIKTLSEQQRNNNLNTTTMLCKGLNNHFIFSCFPKRLYYKVMS